MGGLGSLVGFSNWDFQQHMVDVKIICKEMEVREKERLGLTLGRTMMIHHEGHLCHSCVKMAKMLTGIMECSLLERRKEFHSLQGNLYSFSGKLSFLTYSFYKILRYFSPRPTFPRTFIMKSQSRWIFSKAFFCIY